MMATDNTEKAPPVTTTTTVLADHEASFPPDPDTTKSTAADAAAMNRMGKSQELIRNFRFFSIMSFVAIATASWEIGLFVVRVFRGQAIWRWSS
jgi:hypothetical protein